jgi:dTDP-4-amino-4,6-dideoxygalactose transaminase
MSKQLAIAGGKPAFENSLSQQNYLPEWNAFTEMIDGIFERKYYTNHGPLGQKLEKELSGFLNVKHAICMTNTGIGLMIAAKALDLKGKVIIPAFAHISLAQAIIWAGLEPVFCDVDENTFHLNANLLEKKIDKNTSAILGVNLFGGTCDYEAIKNIANNFSINHYYLSDDAIGEQYKKNIIGNFGSMEIFSLHESKIINCTNGCVITTNDDFIASRLRNIRSSYGSGPAVPIAFTGNGRMSEVQAGMGLLSMENYYNKIELNQKIALEYESNVNGIEGIEIYKPDVNITRRNYQRFVIRIDKNKFGINAPQFFKVLCAENIFVNTFEHYSINPYSPSDRLAGVLNASILSESLLELPLRETLPDIICAMMKQVFDNSDKIKSVLNVRD